jgi:hypothetical protein
MLEQLFQLKKIIPHLKDVPPKNHPNVFKARLYFEDFIARNTVVQSDFDLDIRFKKYNFLIV